MLIIKLRIFSFGYGFIALLLHCLIVAKIKEKITISRLLPTTEYYGKKNARHAMEAQKIARKYES